MKRKPVDIKYSSTHMWVRPETGDKVTMGLTDYFLKDAENITSITLPKVGEAIEEGFTLGEIETDDNTYSIISPISGKAQEVNKEVLKNPASLLEEPYDEGWLIKVKLNDPSKIDSLMSKRQYEESVIEEEEEETGEDYAEEEEEEI